MALPDQRRVSILKAVEEQGSVSVVSLATQLDVSMMTIRRDLAELEEQGVVRRVHGGAVAAHGRSLEVGYSVRADHMLAEKERIGRLAASLIGEGDTISLDIGTTTLEIARNLPKVRNLTVVTPSLHVATLLLNHAEVRLIVTGGIARAQEGSLVGELARSALRSLHVDRLFLAAGGIDAEHGLSEYNWDDALVKQAMIAGAHEVIAVIDSSKFGRVAFAQVAELTQIHKVVTDARPPVDLSRRLEAAGVQVLIAGAMGKPG